MGEGPADGSRPRIQWWRHDAFDEVVACFFLAACGRSSSKFVAWCRSAMQAITWAVPAILIAIATEIANVGGRRGDKGMAQKYGSSTKWDGW